MNRQLTLVSLIAACCAPLAAAQAVNYAQARPAPARLAATSELLSRPAGIVVRDAALADALTLLSDRSHVPIAFSASLLPDGHHPVTCSCETATVAEALARLLAGTNLDYKEVHGQVVIFPRAGTAPATDLVLDGEWPEPPGGLLADGLRPSQVVSAPLRRQGTGVLRGTVTEAGTGRPIATAQVMALDIQVGAVTDAAGRYVILNVPVGTHRVQARAIGFGTKEQSVTVGDGETVQADFGLATAAIALDEVVVTGTGAPAARRTLGNAVTTIRPPEVLQQVVNTNVAELLQAKAPGVTVLASSGTPGATGIIRIRGVTSLVSTSEAVIYVDGIRVNASAGGSFRNNYQGPAEGQVAGGGQTASALDAINPEDIESIEVIKGPAAATLYGADAANGVIQIITKRGQAGDQKLQWNARTQFGNTGWAIDRRRGYTTCDAAHQSLPAEWPGCQGVPLGTVISADFLSGRIRSGNLSNNTISVRGGGRGYSFYVGIDRDREEGILSNSDNERTGTRANFAFFPSPRVDFAVNLGFSRSQTAFPAGDNGPGFLNSVWTYQPGRVPQPGQTYGFAYGDADQLARIENQLSGDHLLLGTTLVYRPVTWFRHRVTVGGDILSQEAMRYAPPGGLFFPVAGQTTQGAPKHTVYTVDYAGTVDHHLPLGALPSILTIGAQYYSIEDRNTVAQGTGFADTIVRNIGSATTRYSWDEFQAVKSLGLFAQEQVAWRERLYLTGALRIDNNSLMGDDIQQLYYPKLSASYVISEEPFLQGRYPWLDNLRLRLAYGHAGNAPPALAKVTTYATFQSVDPVTGAVVTGLRVNTIGNPAIKPERGVELEGGFDAAVLGNLLGVEFTFYNKTTRGAIMRVPQPPSVCSGCTRYENVGRINNRGLELSLLATPIRGHQLTWESRLGLFTNRNRLVSFGYNADTIPTGVTTQNQRHVAGYPLAGYWVHDPVDTGGGNFIPGPVRFLGPSIPTREASFGNTITIRGNLRLFALLDYKGGHYLLNETDHDRCVASVCAEINDPNVAAARKAALVQPLTTNDALYTERADFIKIRELSLTYALPTRWAGRLRADRVAVTLAAHNVGFLWKPYKGSDPEVTFNGVNQAGADTRGGDQTYGWVREDLWTMPMMRRFTMSVDVSF